MRNLTDPVRTYGTGMLREPDSYTETHPSYATIGYTVCHSNGHSLAGSDVKHHSYVCVRVETAALIHDHNRTNPMTERTIIEVDMTHSQFAQFITTPNQGVGAFCTLRSFDGKSVDQPNVASRYQEATDETNAAIQKALEAVKKADKELDAAMATGKIGEIRKAYRNLKTKLEHLPANVEFAQKSLNEFTEAVVSHAKTEVEATLNAAVRQLGLEATAATQKEISDSTPTA